MDATECLKIVRIFDKKAADELVGSPMSMRGNFSPRLESIERVHVFVTSGILMEYPIF
jgi:hypothetical protein